MLLNWLRSLESSRDPNDGGGARRAGGNATGFELHPGQRESGRDRGLNGQSFMGVGQFHVFSDPLHSTHWVRSMFHFSIPRRGFKINDLLLKVNDFEIGSGSRIPILSLKAKMLNPCFRSWPLRAGGEAWSNNRANNVTKEFRPGHKAVRK